MASKLLMPELFQLGGKARGGRNFNDVQRGSWIFRFFCITCAICLHSRVTLLKQDLAIFLFTVGSYWIKYSKVRQY